MAQGTRPSRTPNLEAETRQRGPVSDADLLSSRVLTLGTLMRRSASLLYRELFGLSQNDWTILAVVGRHPPLSLSSLAEAILLDQGQLSRAVSSLVERGFLQRRPSARGGREIEIAFTEEGAALHANLLEAAARRNETLMRGLSKEEGAELARLLDRVTINARELLGEAQRELSSDRHSGAREARARNP